MRPLIPVATHLVELLKSRRLVCATAESCTGGGIGAAITAIPGSSEVYAGGVVSYSNEVKNRVLGVSGDDLARVGAVSGEVAGQMAAGARRLMRADIAVSVTGIAGPGGGSAEKPVGLVWFGLATGAGTRSEKCLFRGDRTEVREQAVLHALGMLSVAAIDDSGQSVTDESMPSAKAKTAMESSPDDSTSARIQNRFFAAVAEVLDVDAVSPDDEFRRVVGWCSLKGFGLLVLLENDWNAPVSLARFAELKTVRDLWREAFLALAASVFGVARETLRGDLGKGEIPSWDSVNHLRLVMEAEARFGVSYPLERVPTLATLDDFLR